MRPRLAALGDDHDDAEAGLARTPTSPAPLGAALGVPIALDTDVNAAAIGEWRHGAARGLDTFVYLTVGTGIGGGVFAGGRPVHGLLHPEVGHMLVPHDRERDPFPAACPFHGDCLEGLASGPALARAGERPGEELTDPEVWELEAEYLALGLITSSSSLSAERIVLGGGVGGAPGPARARPRPAARAARRLRRRPQLGAGIDAYVVAAGARHPLRRARRDRARPRGAQPRPRSAVIARLTPSLAPIPA